VKVAMIPSKSGKTKISFAFCPPIVTTGLSHSLRPCMTISAAAQGLTVNPSPAPSKMIGFRSIVSKRLASTVSKLLVIR
jgi:hypothetical protein